MPSHTHAANATTTVNTTIQAINGPRTDEVFQGTFNAGVMLYNPKKNAKDVYASLLNLLNPSIFEKVSSGHSDQYVLNRYFELKVNWIDPSYNYILREVDIIEAKTGLSRHKAILWQYIRKPKPWNFKRLLKNKLKGKEAPKYMSEWSKEYTKYLSTAQKGVLNRMKVLLIRAFL